ncbi:MAG: carbon-nitrogen hydrolase family protein [Candidatus Acidiferrales bacterium]
MTDLFRIALATPPFPKSIDHGMECVEKFVREASERQAAIVCFPESYVPGYRGADEPVAPHSAAALQASLERAQALARQWRITVILPMDWDHADGILNVAAVITSEGVLLGSQSKNQLDPTEDRIYVPGNKRQLFEVSGIKFGISICHEGFRYPEAVRWAARRGASIVFHPHCTGSNHVGKRPNEFRSRENPYYEQAIMCRALENNIFFASINYAFAFQESATCIIGPSGDCLGYQAYGESGLLVAGLDLTQATRNLAVRYNASAYV